MLLPSQRYVLLTGTSAQERALDAPIGGKYHGLFSYALYQSLKSVPLDATAGEVFSGFDTVRGIFKLFASLLFNAVGMGVSRMLLCRKMTLICENMYVFGGKPIFFG